MFLKVFLMVGIGILNLSSSENQPHMVLVDRPSSGIHLQVIVDLSWSPNRAKVWSLSDNQPCSTTYPK